MEKSFHLKQCGFVYTVVKNAWMTIQKVKQSLILILIFMVGIAWWANVLTDIKAQPKVSAKYIDLNDDLFLTYFVNILSPQFMHSNEMWI